MVALQTALAMGTVLISSGLMIRIIAPHPAGIQSLLRVFIPEAQVNEPVRVVHRPQQEMQQKLAAIPGVTSVAFANSVPTDGNNTLMLFYAEDRFYREGQLTRLQVHRSRILPDHGYAPDCVCDHLDRCLRDALRRTWRASSGTIVAARNESRRGRPWREIVGVVADVRPLTTVYWPILTANFSGDRTFVGVVFAVHQPCRLRELSPAGAPGSVAH